MGLDQEAARALLLDAIASGRHAALADIDDVDVEVDWVGVNGARVDARLRTHEGGEWHVVLLVDPGGADPVAEAVAFRRPTVEPLAGVLVVVNGPAGVGKSSLLAALPLAQPTVPWVVFDEPVLGQVASPFLIWPEAVPWLHTGFLAGIATVAAAGACVGVAAAGHPLSRFASAAAAAGVRLVTIGLHAPREVLLDRERGRDGRWGGLAEQSLAAHAGWTYDLELDSASHAPQHLAERVLEVLPRSA